MDEQTQTVTIKKIPSDLWKAVRIKALATGQSVSELATKALRQIVNGKSK